MRQMTYSRDILLKSGLLLAMILKRLLVEDIGIINDALSRIPPSTTQSSKLSCSTNSLVQQGCADVIDQPEVIFDQWQQISGMRSLSAWVRVEFYKSGLLPIISAQADTFVGQLTNG